MGGTTHDDAKDSSFLTSRFTADGTAPVRRSGLHGTANTSRAAPSGLHITTIIASSRRRQTRSCRAAAVRLHRSCRRGFSKCCSLAIYGTYPVILRALKVVGGAPLPAVFVTCVRYLYLTLFAFTLKGFRMWQANEAA